MTKKRRNKIRRKKGISVPNKKERHKAFLPHTK